MADRDKALLAQWQRFLGSKPAEPTPCAFVTFLRRDIDALQARVNELEAERQRLRTHLNNLP